MKIATKVTALSFAGVLRRVAWIVAEATARARSARSVTIENGKEPGR